MPVQGFRLYLPTSSGVMVKVGCAVKPKSGVFEVNRDEGLRSGSDAKGF